MVGAESPEVLWSATDHEDPPSGISLRQAMAAFLVSALLAGGFFVVQAAVTDDEPLDPCAATTGVERENCTGGLVTRG